MENLDNYFNLIENNIEDLEIVENWFDCLLKNKEWKTLKWFLLAKSDKWNSYTICEVSFQESGIDKRYKSRLTFKRTNKKLQDIIVRKDVIYQRITFEKWDDWCNEFWEMISFLQWFNKVIDLWDFDKKYKVLPTIEEIQDKINLSNFSQEQIENLSKNIIYKERKKSLITFEKLLWFKTDNDGKVIINELDNDGRKFIKEYREENLKEFSWEEAVWHYFLKNNSWIIWLNLDLKFIEDFIDEGDVWIKDINWKWSPKVDIVGYSDYTVLIELKTANKNIFTERKKSKTWRTNTWSFTDDFIDWISKCLAQKSEHDKERKDIKRENDDWKKEILKEIRTIDTDCIFIIWNKEREFPLKSILDEDDIKKDTFKRFRENSKNIKIITYDELYERAKNILELS